MKYTPKDYEVRVWFSPEDKCFIAEAPDFPGHSTFGDTRDEAAREFDTMLGLLLEVYAEDKQEPPTPRSAAARALGRTGGRASSVNKRRAAQRNGRKGGRPRKVEQTA